MGRSRVLRVSGKFADYVLGEHKKSGIPITRITDEIADARPIIAILKKQR
jgi:hypothetical protein